MATKKGRRFKDYDGESNSDIALAKPDPEHRCVYHEDDPYDRDDATGREQASLVDEEALMLGRA